MVLKYNLTKDGDLKDFSFEGLNGQEEVGTTKEAMKLLRVDNPLAELIRQKKIGAFEGLSEAEEDRMLEKMAKVCSLWSVSMEKEDFEKGYGSENVLTLLARALELITVLELKEE